MALPADDSQQITPEVFGVPGLQGEAVGVSQIVYVVDGKVAAGIAAVAGLTVSEMGTEDDPAITIQLSLISLPEPILASRSGHKPQ